MDERTLENFLKKFTENQYTEQEHDHFIAWLDSLPEEDVELLLGRYSEFFQALADREAVKHPDLLQKIDDKLNHLENEANMEYVGHPKRSYKKFIAIAATILLLVTVKVVLNVVSNRQQITSNHTLVQKIIPGGNKAVLTLGDGSQIVLDSTKNGLLAHQQNSLVRKAGNDRLVYDASQKQNLIEGKTIAYNTISTPKGGQYQVILSDGTKVWLNAASSLKFPVTFVGKERNVELLGEGYFEVAKDKAMPFRVTINNSVVEVLGTHFNIMGYTDEKSTNTTLLEGSVKIISGNKEKLLVPGEQASVNDEIKVNKVNAEEAIAWKNGKFNFAHENIETIMRKVARWYDVSVQYQGVLTHEGFVGTVPRSGNITEVLNSLELTGLVHFKIDGRRVIVMP